MSSRASNSLMLRSIRAPVYFDFGEPAERGRRALPILMMTPVEFGQMIYHEPAVRTQFEGMDQDRPLAGLRRGIDAVTAGPVHPFGLPVLHIGSRGAEMSSGDGQVLNALLRLKADRIPVHVDRDQAANFRRTYGGELVERPEDRIGTDYRVAKRLRQHVSVVHAYRTNGGSGPTLDVSLGQLHAELNAAAGLSRQQVVAASTGPRALEKTHFVSHNGARDESAVSTSWMDRAAHFQQSAAAVAPVLKAHGDINFRQLPDAVRSGLYANLVRSISTGDTARAMAGPAPKMRPA